MPLTLQLLLPGSIMDSAGNVVPINDVGARIYDRSTPTIVETVNTVTRSADGTFSFSPILTGYLPTQLYEVALFEKSSGELLTTRGRFGSNRSTERTIRPTSTRWLDTA